MTRQSRRERRQLELQDRRERRRARPVRRQRSMLLPISIGAIVVGVLGVIAFALLNAPPASVDLDDPITRSPYQLADRRALGADDAPVTMEIWSDFQCPACGVLARQVEPQLAEDYLDTGELRIVYRDFAFLGQESTDASEAAYCAGEQNRFWQFHDYLFANQSGENRGAFSARRLDAMAERVGLDMDAYRACRTGGEARAEIQSERQAAQAIPINSTPSLIIGERMFAGVPEYQQLRAAIEEALEAAGTEP